MPIQFTSKNGYPAVRWGSTGKRFKYKQNDSGSLERAKSRARHDGKRIEYFKKVEKESNETTR